MSVLSISTVLMLFALLAAESGFRTRATITTYEDSLTAKHLARSCAFVGLLTLAQGSMQGVGEVTVAENRTCSITRYSNDYGSFEIGASGLAGNSIGIVRISGHFASSSKAIITTWSEM